MNRLIRWLREPVLQFSAFKLWLVSAFLVFGIWLGIPMLLGVQFRIEYLAIPISTRNLAATLSTSFGEEFVFRVLPMLTVLTLVPKRTTWAVLACLIVVIPFSMWHEWVITAKTCLGLGGIVLGLVYLKFGGASGKPFRGFIACGSIHATCNIAVIIIANIATSGMSNVAII